MHSLADLQSAFARAMTSGDDAALTTMLPADGRTGGRLAIHLRHYETSLTTALGEKFPACAWLVGAEQLRQAARAYVRAHPPSEPCIAEYGRDFPTFLATRDYARALPYLKTFAELELAIAQVSIEVDRAPLGWSELSRFGAERLLDSTLVFQPGLRYVHSPWRIDELMATYLRDSQPERFALEESSSDIEIRGARGAVRLARLDTSIFRFRAELAAGRTLGDAAEAALEVSAAFDPAAGLRELFESGLAVDVRYHQREKAT